MDSLSSQDRDRALKVIGVLAAARLNGRSDEDVYEGLEFGSVEAMHVQLRNWGLPAWLAGEIPSEGRPAKERKARRGGGPAVPVPVLDAVPLLRRAVEDLERLQMRVEAGRFVVEHRLYGAAGKDVLTEGVEGEAVRVYRRDALSPDYWRRLCEKHGLDPDDPARLSIMVPVDLDRRDGGTLAPPETLTALVATYVVTGGDVEELLDALNPNPDEVDRAALYKDDPKRPGPIAGLKRYAEQVATVVCGGTVRRGRPDPRVSQYEHRAASYVKMRRAQGAADEEILTELHEGKIWPLPVALNLEEVRRLGGLNLR